MPKALWLLTLVNLLNYLDRYIVSSAAPKIEEEFQMSHMQTGLIMSAFMIGYMVTSPVFGWLADRQNRPRLMALGVGVWSVATGVTGLTYNVFQLFLTRIFVGVGEASYAAISPSYLRDKIGDEQKVNKAISILYTAIPLGAALGYMWGGYMSDHHGWRWAFILAAVPGLLFTPIVFLLKDGRHTEARDGENDMSMKETLKSLATNRGYRLTVLGYTAHTFGLGGFAAWAPHYCANTLSLPLSTASFKIGAITCIAGVVGTLIGGYKGSFFVRKMQRAGEATDQSTSEDLSVRGFNLFSACSSLLATPFAFWMLSTTSATEFMAAMLLVQVALFASLSPINTATLAAVPVKMAATAFATQIFVIHALGDIISPPLVGWLGDRMPMASAMHILVVAIFMSAAIWFLASRKGTGFPPPSSSIIKGI